MNIQEVNKIFKSKYPNGEILQKGSFQSKSTKSAFGIIYDNTKEYYKIYTVYAQNYAELLQKLHFDVISEKQQKSYINIINTLKQQLSATYIDEFFGEMQRDQATIKHNKELIKEYQAKLNNSIIL